MVDGAMQREHDDRNMHSLCSVDKHICFQISARALWQVHFRAQPGTPGGGSKMAGRAGVDTFVRLPPGTIVRRRDAKPGEPPLAELLEPGGVSAPYHLISPI